MSLLSLVIALLLEQWHPMSWYRGLQYIQYSYADFFYHAMNGGLPRHGRVAWFAAMLPLLLLTVSLYFYLLSVHVLLALAYCVVVLYFTLGFRIFSHSFTAIHKALKSGEIGRARKFLEKWRGESCEDCDIEMIVRITLEEALLATHRNVFAVGFWFVFFMFIGLGPTGAVLYRIGALLKQRWIDLDTEEASPFSIFASEMIQFIEYIPSRMTAFSFAIAGNFEDAVYCWRTQAGTWPDRVSGIVLASGAGALGVRLGMPIEQQGLMAVRPELGVGDRADIDFMQSAVGLVWRAVIFWLIILMLLTMASMMQWTTG